MGFRLGEKLTAGLESSARLGKKVLGTTARIGHKIASEGGSAVSMIERIPILGAALGPATGVIRSGLGLIQNVADLAGTGNTLLTGAEGVIRSGQNAIKSGDMVVAMDALRRGKELGQESRSTLERARKVATDAGALGRASGSAFAQSQRNLNKGVVGGLMGALM